MKLQDVEDKLPSRISRRTIVKGAAWTTPVIVLATAAPAAAASRIAEVNAAMTAEKNAEGKFGGKNVTFTVPFHNAGDLTARVEVLSMSLAGTTLTGIAGIPDAFDVAGGATVTKTYVWLYGDNASNGTYTLSYKVGTTSLSATVTV